MGTGYFLRAKSSRPHFDAEKQPVPILRRAALLPLLFAAVGAQAASLPHARELAAALDYAGAQTEAAAALQAGSSSPEEVLALHALLGELHAALGDEAAAIASFRAALTLAPDWRPPSGASPKVLGPFQRALALTGGARLSVEVHSRAEAGGEVTTSLKVTQDPAQLVQAARLYAPVEGRISPVQVALERGPSTSLGVSGDRSLGVSGERSLGVSGDRSLGVSGDRSLGVNGALRWRCAAPPCPHFVALLDAHGNEVLRLGSPFLPLPVEGLTPSAKPLLRPATVLAGAAVVATAVAVGFGIRFAQTDTALAGMEADRGANRYASAQALETQRHQAWVGLWLGVGVAAGSGGAAALTW